MKRKIPALVLALGLSAMPVSAKQTSRRADTKDTANSQESKDQKKRVANTFKRLKKLELEKEYIRETEDEISRILKY
ncbi:MAG: hypothetical protein NE334_21630 [Lentisphaeraceae bacterium]|nr:hypothetical protein [Lentisphaeraceae bacterium]